MPMMADGSDNKSTSEPITLILHPINTESNPTIHRAPMRTYVEGYYDAWTQTITIQYDGEATGEVHLYRDEIFVDSSCEINTTFMLIESGFYTIEIITDSWSAIGSIDI